jgi:hypothetical protein
VVDDDDRPLDVAGGLSGSERLVRSPPDGLEEGMRVVAEDTKRN